MSHEKNHLPPPLDLSGWRSLPTLLIIAGGILSIIGLVKDPREFGYSWLLAFIFYFSIALGALFLVIVHHLTDAGWSVGILRFNEHLASLLRWPLTILFLPILLLASKIYGWLSVDPATDNTVAAKLPVFTCSGFIITSAIFFAIWWFLTSRLSSLSLQQDKTGAAELTRKLRFHSGWGIVAFALTLTGAAVLWVKALEHEWYSAMYGVYFFGSSVWVTLATVYCIAAVLRRQQILSAVLQPNYFYFIGVLFFAFTLFQAYIEFAQYFVVWNANMPTETFWYLIRENGNWFALSMILIFGHFFVPFFLLLPVKAKTTFKVIIPVCLWAWLMHAADLAFNILPAAHHEGYPLKWIWLPLGCLLFMGGFLTKIFLHKFNAHPPYPQRDPRLLEAMGVSANVVHDLGETSPGGAR
jgi:hypothetical protein